MGGVPKAHSSSFSELDWNISTLRRPNCKAPTSQERLRIRRSHWRSRRISSAAVVRQTACQGGKSPAGGCLAFLWGFSSSQVKSTLKQMYFYYNIHNINISHDFIKERNKNALHKAFEASFFLKVICNKTASLVKSVFTWSLNFPPGTRKASACLHSCYYSVHTQHKTPINPIGWLSDGVWEHSTAQCVSWIYWGHWQSGTLVSIWNKVNTRAGVGDNGAGNIIKSSGGDGTKKTTV